MAVGLHIGCPRLVGNSNLQEFFCTMQYFYPTTLNGIADQIFQRRARGGAKLDAPPILTILYFVFPFQFDYMTLSTSRKNLVQMKALNGTCFIERSHFGTLDTAIALEKI